MRKTIRLTITILLGFALVVVAALVANGGFRGVVRDISALTRWAYARVIPNEKIRRTRALEQAHVEREVEKAVAQRDFRLVGIGGIGLFFPGLDSRDGRVERVTSRFGYRVIEGTSDYIDSPEQAQFQTAAYEYARRYNLNLWPQIPK